MIIYVSNATGPLLQEEYLPLAAGEEAFLSKTKYLHLPLLLLLPEEAGQHTSCSKPKSKPKM